MAQRIFLVVSSPLKNYYRAILLSLGILTGRTGSAVGRLAFRRSRVRVPLSAASVVICIVQVQLMGIAP